MMHKQSIRDDSPPFFWNRVLMSTYYSIICMYIQKIRLLSYLPALPKFGFKIFGIHIAENDKVKN